MSKDDFEKGLNLLLNNAYNVPTPDEDFRSQLLEDLKSRQRVRAGARRSRIITLYSSFSAVAAVLIFAFIPSVGIFSNTETQETAISQNQFAATSKVLDKEINTDKLVTLTSTTESTTKLASYTTKLASYTTNSFNPTSAQAINTLDVFNPNTNKWDTITEGQRFALSNGTQVRTPLGATESVNFTIENGPSIMMDGMSQVALINNTIALEDGRAVVSVDPNKNPMTLSLDNQDINLQPGSMVFATLDNDNTYADSGIPAPMLVLLKGNATTANSHNTTLAQGRVYELFDTGTGRYPSRKVGSYENKRQFMPMIDAVQATYKSYK